MSEPTTSDKPQSQPGCPASDCSAICPCCGKEHCPVGDELKSWRSIATCQCGDTFSVSGPGTCGNCLATLLSSEYARGQAANLKQELMAWLDQQTITSENIGNIRRMCFVPWSSAWNALVRDETAQRENKSPNAKGQAGPPDSGHGLQAKSSNEPKS